MNVLASWEWVALWCFSEDDRWGVALKEAWQSHPLQVRARTIP